MSATPMITTVVAGLQTVVVRKHRGSDACAKAANLRRRAGIGEKGWTRAALPYRYHLFYCTQEHCTQGIFNARQSRCLQASARTRARA